VNIEFIKWADQNRIMLHVMPPHSTHRLQPLDVGVFGPLSIAYSNELNILIHNSMGVVSMSERLFYPLFRAAYEEIFYAKKH
jgi:hypothetical protein